MKRVSIAEVLSALELQIVPLAVLIGVTMDAEEIRRMSESDEQSDNEALNMMKIERKIIYFFGHKDCPILSDTQVDLLIAENLYIVKLV